MSDYDVAIVGYGPVGATLANLLGMCGVSVVVLEREAGAYHLPRAVHFDDEVMRVFQTIGLAEQIGKKSRYNPGMRFVDDTGKLLLDWPRPPGTGRNGWFTSYRFHQPDLEAILRQGVSRFESVTLMARSEVTAISSGEHCAQISYTDLQSSEKRTLSAGYVVGCDGGRSTVRKIIGSDIDDLGFRERWLVVDTLLNGPKPELGDFTIQYCNPSRPVTYVRGPENRRRWEITLLEHEDAKQISQPESVWGLLADWLSPAEATLERAAVYTFHSMIAGQWRKGRVLLAGDAAHQMPPFMGQGMCTGIRDVSNLAWKLVACLTGKADDSLLDSYQSERYPHVNEFIDTAIRLGGLINSCATEEALHLAFRQNDGSATMKMIAPALGPGLTVGNTEFAGMLAPQYIMADGVKHDDHSGYAAVLLIDSRLASCIEPASDLCTLTTDACPEVREALKLHGVSALFVRPDRYFLGGADTPAQLAELLKHASQLGLMVKSGDHHV